MRSQQSTLRRIGRSRYGFVGHQHVLMLRWSSVGEGFRRPSRLRWEGVSLTGEAPTFPPPHNTRLSVPNRCTYIGSCRIASALLQGEFLTRRAKLGALLVQLASHAVAT
jgi:hypothetical protein